MAYEIEDAASDMYWIIKYYGREAPLEVSIAMKKVARYLDGLDREKKLTTKTKKEH